MRKTIFILSILFLSNLVLAQPAPDFTITNTQGDQIELYADLLDQGKTVVLKIFFTWCPPCNAIASQTETLYQSWGGGNNDVEFISLSDKSADVNTMVASYKANHGLTYPGAGSDGGSLQAIQPYIGGTYGFFLGTPTFVVIAPDGTVNFDPRGPNSQATLDSVSVAIAATGALMPFVNYTADGHVQSMSDSGVYEVAIDIENIDNINPLTDIDGNFSFSSLLAVDQSYSLTANKDTDSYLNGLSTSDLIMISQHILGVDTFTSPLQLIAADADRNSKITTLDIIWLRRLILGFDMELSNQPPWIFVDSSYTFDNATKPYNEVYNGTATVIPLDPTAPPNIQFTGIKIGDVNGSVDPDF